jgi:adenylylsulfate kinase-like enzyme
MIILLNGSINSGKSTIAKILVNKISNTALLEIDSLREMIDYLPLNEAIPINLENTVSLIKNFVSHNINVIVPYPLSEANYEYIINELKDMKDKIYVFTLSPNLEKAIINRGTRELTEQEIDRIKYHYDTGINKPLFGEIIDNSNQTPEETADLILEKIK